MASVSRQALIESLPSEAKELIISKAMIKLKRRQALAHDYCDPEPLLATLIATIEPQLTILENARRRIRTTRTKPKPSVFVALDAVALALAILDLDKPKGA